MRGVLLAILIVVLFNFLPPGLALLAAGLVWWLSRSQPPHPRPPITNNTHNKAQETLLALLLLRQQFHERQSTQPLAEIDYAAIMAELDQQIAEKTQRLWPKPVQIQMQWQRAWDLLNMPEHRWQRPDWLNSAATAPTTVTTTATEAPKLTLEQKISAVAPVSPPIERAEPIPPLTIAPALPLPQLTRSLSERMGHWIKNLLIPLIWHNIGWLLGGFMFVSGSVFLIAYTTGFNKALAVLVTLSLYTVLLLWGAYQMRRLRQSLTAGSQALAMIAVLLMPLLLSTAVRLSDAAGAQPGLQLIAVLLNAVLLALLWWLLPFASALIERGFSQTHARLLLALSAVQLALPLLTLFPNWPLLAGLHLLLLALLAGAIRQFLSQWLQSLLVERQLTAYFLVGSLLFAGAVSFIHLIGGSSIPLPVGYLGPFVMALALLLFYVDFHLKRWLKQVGWLDYFSFVVYAVSIIGLLLSWQGQITAALLLSLILATGLYAAMVWHYLTLTPLYLLVMTLAGLYGFVILRHCPQASYFLASLPGFWVLLNLQKIAQYRQAPTLAIVTHRLLLVLLAGLVGWSLLPGKPSLLAMLTPLVAAGVVQIIAQQNAQYPEWQRYFNTAYRSYFWVLLLTLALIYTPRLAGDLQLGLSFSGLGLGLALTGLRNWRHPAPIWPASALLNSSLILLLGGLALNALLTSSPLVFATQALLSGVVIVGLSARLRVPGLLYVGLFGLGIAAALFKQHYINSPETGAGKFLAALFLAASWGILQHRCRQLQHLQQALNLPQSTPLSATPVRLFGRWPIGELSWSATLNGFIAPVSQTTALLWGLGLLNLMQFYSQWAILPWTVTTLAIVTTVVLAGQSRQLSLLPIALGLIMAGWHSQLALPHTGLGVELTAYSLLLWGMGVYGLRPAAGWFQRLHWVGQFGAAGGRALSHTYLHRALLLTTSVGLLLTGLEAAHFGLELFPGGSSLALAGLFFALSGYYYRSWLHSYGVLALTSSLILLLVSVLLHLEPHRLLQQPEQGLSLALITLILLQWGQRLQTNPAPLAALYALPLQHWASLTGSFSVGYTVYGVLPALRGLATDYWSGWAILTVAVWIAIILMATRTWANAPAVRSFWVPGLIALVIGYGWLTLPDLSPYLPSGLGFALGLIGYYGMPRLNQAWPVWAIAPQGWLWFGLILVITAWLSHPNLPLLAITTAYCGLMLYALQWQVFAWAVALGASGCGLLLSHLLNPTIPGRMAWFILWLNALLALVPLWQRHYPQYAESVRHALTRPLMVISLLWFGGILASLPMPELTLTSQFGLLVLLASSSFTQTLLVADSPYRVYGCYAGYGLALLALHLLWPLLFAGAWPDWLPWYALQAAMFLTLSQKLMTPHWLPMALHLPHRLAPFWVALSGLFWLGYATLELGGGPWPPYHGLDRLAAILALLLLFSEGYRRNWHSAALKLYALAFLVALMLGTLRIGLLGFAPFTAWDTAVLLAVSYAVLGLQPKPATLHWFYLTAGLPWLVLLTLSWQWASLQTTAAILASSLIYLLMPRPSRQQWPIWLGLLGLNLGIYLWVPLLATQTHLFQVYTLPAALSVLLLLHLNPLEVTRTTAHQVRLAALIVLYSSATGDVFLRPELGIFILAIGLSLGGIVIGLAGRIRAFFYSGQLFLLINVLGQLVQFYPEQRLGKALVLMALGSLITLGMIVFNLHREAIVRRMALVRENLKQWQ